MKVLGIETSGGLVSIGIVENGIIKFKSSKVQSSVSVGELDCLGEKESICELLRENKIRIEEIDGISVAVGPGSFTGIRVGVASAKGFGTALGKPVIGVPTMDAIVEEFLSFILNSSFFIHNSIRVNVIIDARNERVYSSEYEISARGWKNISPLWVMSIGELVARLNELCGGYNTLPSPVFFVGNGVEFYGEFIKEKMGTRARFLSKNIRYAKGEWVAKLGYEKLCRGETGEEVKEIYL